MRVYSSCWFYVCHDGRIDFSSTQYNLEVHVEVRTLLHDPDGRMWLQSKIFVQIEMKLRLRHEEMQIDSILVASLALFSKFVGSLAQSVNSSHHINLSWCCATTKCRGVERRWFPYETKMKSKRAETPTKRTAAIATRTCVTLRCCLAPFDRFHRNIFRHFNRHSASATTIKTLVQHIRWVCVLKFQRLVDSIDFSLLRWFSVFRIEAKNRFVIRERIKVDSDRWTLLQCRLVI